MLRISKESRALQTTSSSISGGVKGLLGAIALLAISTPAMALDEYPSPAQVSFSEMGRGISTAGGFIFVGSDTYGNDLQGSNSGDDYVGAAFLYSQGNPNPIRSYIGDSAYGNLGLDTAMTTTWLAASSTQPPTVHLARAPSWGQFPSTFTQELVFPDAPFTARPAIDMTAQHLVVGVPGGHSDEQPLGRVYVYSYHSGQRRWVNPVELVPGWGNFDSTYGASVAIDGERIIVGTPGSGVTGGVYIFERNAQGQWVDVYQGASWYSVAGGSYGEDVDISGNYAVVSDPSAVSVGGFVHLLVRQNGSWQSDTFLLGESVTDVTVSGNKMALGYGLDNWVATYQRSGSAWSQMGSFESQDYVRLGAGVALNGDFIVMGAPSYSESPYDFKGAAYSASIWESWGGFTF